MDLRFTAEEEGFRAEAREWLEPNVPHGLPSGDTREGFALHRDWERKLYRRVPAAQRAVRSAVYYRGELLFLPSLLKSQRLELIRKMAVEHLEKQVPDPELRPQIFYGAGCANGLEHCFQLGNIR